MSTTENGRPEREARFHSADSASQKKRRVLIPVRPSVMDCCCSFWKTKALCSAVASKIGQRVENQNILRRECVFVAALDVEHAQQRLAVGDRNAQHGARIGQNPVEIARQRILHQRAFAGAGDPAENAGPERNAPAHGVCGCAGFGFDLDFFGAVVEQADADMIEAEVLLDLADDLAQHVHRIIARNCRARNVVEEGKMPRAALLFGEQARILHRDRDLSGSRYQHIQIALLEHEFPVRMHRHHDSGRSCCRGKSARRSGIWLAAAERELMPSSCASSSRSDRMSRGSPVRITYSVNALRSSRAALGQHANVANFELEANFVVFLKRDVEMAGIENLPQLSLDACAESRPDRAAN